MFGDRYFYFQANFQSAFKKSAIGVRSKSPIPTRQKICQSIGNKNSKVSIEPHINEIGKAINMPKVKSANRFSKQIMTFSTIYLPLLFQLSRFGHWSANVGWVLKCPFHSDKKDANTSITIQLTIAQHRPRASYCHQFQRRTDCCDRHQRHDRSIIPVQKAEIQQ